FVFSFFLYSIMAGILIIVLIGIVLLPIVELVGFIFMIVAAVRAYEGEMYRIPIVIHFISNDSIDG
ncbi:DUF4870 domain-containing protein, partial [Bacillaceae bacterium Marseille-Q3522]|nr:DUF4870 domain-containing protein [Bacillaceae bacterium Marseille-Q3522]